MTKVTYSIPFLTFSYATPVVVTNLTTLSFPWTICYSMTTAISDEAVWWWPSIAIFSQRVHKYLLSLFLQCNYHAPARSPSSYLANKVWGSLNLYLAEWMMFFKMTWRKKCWFIESSHNKNRERNIKWRMLHKKSLG